MSAWVHADGMSFFPYGFTSGVAKGPVWGESIGVVKLGQEISRREDEETGPLGTKRQPVYAKC